MKRMVVALLLTALLTALCACSPTMPEINTQPLGETVTTAVTKPTMAPNTPLTLGELMGVMGSEMRWSDMQNYKHTVQDAGSAVFSVGDDEGHEANLLLAFDETTDVVTAATLSYGDVSINILTDDTMVIRQIMLAMDEG